jgi:hypothetical protein
MPNTLTSIGDLAFDGCTKLTSISLPESLSSIGYASFYNCGFKSIDIPKNVSYIGEQAFTNITTCRIFARTAPKCNLSDPKKYPFLQKSTKGTVLYVPSGCRDVYEYWNVMFGGIDMME